MLYILESSYCGRFFFDTSKYIVRQFGHVGNFGVQFGYLVIQHCKLSINGGVVALNEINVSGIILRRCVFCMGRESGRWASTGHMKRVKMCSPRHGFCGKRAALFIALCFVLF